MNLCNRTFTEDKFLPEKIKMIPTEFIHVEWEGPFNFDEAKSKTDSESEKFHDFGVYQVYGHHRIYGPETLLYIGKAQKQTLGLRLSQETWWGNTYAIQDIKKISIYLGRLAGAETPGDDLWERQIELVEKLLIFSHTPGWNSSNLNSIPDEDCKNIHILNWGSHRDLLPEVSGARYSSRFETIEGYKTYGSHRSEAQ
jgi:hypothetical protein